ncbi:MAG: hypothetical protein ABI443_08555 [Chthoniobacterales bacterium]
MKSLPVVCLFAVLFLGCAQQQSSSASAGAVNIAKQEVARHEKWAYDGDYKVEDYDVGGKKEGWKVTVLRINDPKLLSSNKSRYYPAAPVIVLIDESGHVISYKSPYRN